MDLDAIDLCDLDRFASGFPHEWFTALRRERPVWFHPPTPTTPGGEGFWVLSTHELVSAAAADAATFSSHTGGEREGGGTLIEDLPEGYAGVLLNMTDGRSHQQFRSLLTPSLSPRALAALEEDLRARARAILAAAIDAGEVDLLVDVAAELPLQAAAGLLGVPQADRHLLLRWADATLDHREGDPEQLALEAEEASAALFAYGAELIERRRREPGDDLLSAAVHGTVSDAVAGDGSRRSLRDDELLLLFGLLCAAGTETTRNTIAVGLAVLAEQPEQWDLLRDEPVLVPGAVEEMLRWASSTPYNRRTATRDVEVGGGRISAGDKVTLWWASANRDEQVFEDPFRFDVRRDPNPHLAFGHGAHFCLGARLARMEVRLLLEELLASGARITSCGPIEWTRSNKHTGVRHLPARLEPT